MDPKRAQVFIHENGEHLMQNLFPKASKHQKEWCDDGYTHTGQGPRVSTYQELTLGSESFGLKI